MPKGPLPLNADKALIFRIIHKGNLQWILRNGLHCRSSPTFDAKYINIGNKDLIAKRNDKAISVNPGGVLSDYIPFYFTPCSPMLMNIATGWQGIDKQHNNDIVILCSSLVKLKALNVPFLFTDRHAYLTTASFFSELDDLSRIDWPILQQIDFKRNPDDPGKFERYQAEALVHKTMPVNALLGVVCHSNETADEIRNLLTSEGVNLQAYVRKGWYF